MTETKQKEIDDALMQLLVGKVLPISLVDSHYFRAFVHLLNPKYEIPSRKTMTSRLGKKKEEIKIKVAGEISKLDDISITHDGWPSINTESFCTVTSHYINENWEMRSVWKSHSRKQKELTDRNPKYLEIARTYCSDRQCRQ